MSGCTNHDKSKTDLSKELETVLKASIAASYSIRENLPSEITQNICNVIEAIFIHGLRDPFFLKGSRYAKYPEPVRDQNFWPFVSKYSHRSITTQINALNQIKSEIGRGRVRFSCLILMYCMFKEICCANETAYYYGSRSLVFSTVINILNIISYISVNFILQAWIRIVLNESSMEHYLQLLLSEKRAMQSKYFAYIYKYFY
uniref:RUN domain-containing protein n=1 Tax=Heterorhabditis bacteriophora TaxID=37862 RepID=A0A1I7X155_HETBA